MRKPRDYDAELKALDDKAKQLKARRVTQLGELVIACGAETLSVEHLAGALLGMSEADAPTKEVWRKRGAGFFQRNGKDGRGVASDASGNRPIEGATKPA